MAVAITIDDDFTLEVVEEEFEDERAYDVRVDSPQIRIEPQWDHEFELAPYRIKEEFDIDFEDGYLTANNQFVDLIHVKEELELDDNECLSSDDEIFETTHQSFSPQEPPDSQDISQECDTNVVTLSTPDSIHIISDNRETTLECAVNTESCNKQKSTEQLDVTTDANTCSEPQEQPQLDKSINMTGNEEVKEQQLNRKKEFKQKDLQVEKYSSKGRKFSDSGGLKSNKNNARIVSAGQKRFKVRRRNRNGYNGHKVQGSLGQPTRVARRNVWLNENANVTNNLSEREIPMLAPPSDYEIFSNFLCALEQAVKQNYPHFDNRENYHFDNRESYQMNGNAENWQSSDSHNYQIYNNRENCQSFQNLNFYHEESQFFYFDNNCANSQTFGVNNPINYYSYESNVNCSYQTDDNSSYQNRLNRNYQNLDNDRNNIKRKSRRRQRNKSNDYPVMVKKTSVVSHFSRSQTNQSRQSRNLNSYKSFAPRETFASGRWGTPTNRRNRPPVWAAGLQSYNN